MHKIFSLLLLLSYFLYATELKIASYNVENLFDMYYVALNDEREGPYDFRTIQQFIFENKIQRETLVWTEGLRDWVEAHTVLEEQFNATPPPLPKI
jgi:hypothetical protein